MFADFVLNGQGNGAIGTALQEVRFEPGLLRPMLVKDKHGSPHRVVELPTGRILTNAQGKEVKETKYHLIQDLQARGINSPVFNAGATLTREAWIEIDRTLVKATRQRLRAWTDLAAANSRGGFNAMSRMTLEYQNMTDAGEAVKDMDGLADGRSDRPLIGTKSIPLPITHSDFWFSQREIAVSRNGGAPLDLTMAEMAGRRVAEMVERTTIGTETGVAFGTRSTGPNPHVGNSQEYGYTNFPYRVTKTDLTTPTGSNPEAVMTDVLEMIETMNGNGYFGPFMLYHSTAYSRYLSDDYFRTGSTSAVRLLRERIMAIEGITDIRRLDFLTSGYQMILVQMTSEVCEAINGMDITTVQWETRGGMQQNFKVMAIKVPLLKTPYNGVAGIIHGTTS